MARHDNVLQSELESIEPNFVADTVRDLRQLHALGRPKTDEQVEERISEFFRFCEKTTCRPGIELLAFSLGVSRETLYRWSHGIQCSERRQAAICKAKGLIASFLEQCVMRGKISPPCGIFLLKNWLNYRDNISIEQTVSDSAQYMNVYETPQDIIQRRQKEVPTLPDELKINEESEDE